MTSEATTVDSFQLLQQWFDLDEVWVDSRCPIACDSVVRANAMLVAIELVSSTLA